VVRLIIIPADA